MITFKIDKYGNLRFYKDGELHRDGDLPAVIYADGTRCWWKNGKRHRDNDLPAIICVNGDRGWFKNGLPHRDGDKPAVISPSTSGTLKRWYKNGEEYFLNEKQTKSKLIAIL